MEANQKGWVVVTGYGFVSKHTFSHTRNEAIKKYTSDKEQWETFKKVNGHRCVKAEMTIKTLE